MKIEPRINKFQWALRFRKSHTFFMLIIVLTFSCSSFQKTEQYSVLDITDFGIKPGTGENAIFAVQEAIEKAKSIDGKVLIKFPVGRYDFRADSSHVKTYFESNTTDNNPKNLAFLIENCQNLIIDGGGSDFVFHGPMQPFSIDNSENITIQNVNIDWDIPLTAQAEVVSATNKIIELKIDTNQFPYVIEDGWLYFMDKTWKEPMWKWGTMEFDVATRLVVPQTGDNGCFRAIDNKYSFEEQKPGIVQMLGEFTRVPAVGNFLVLRHSPRDHAGIFVWHSENIHLENINVYHAAGLGCLSQYSRDLDYRNVNFIPNLQKNRFLSAHDDGFQISNCAGQVNIIDCEFAGLMDDPINVHGTSVRIIEKLDGHRLKCLFVHKQSEGMLWGRPGEEVAFLENESMQTISFGKLKSCEAINISEFIVEFENPVPVEITIGDALENLNWTPNLHIRNCLFGSCRARGLLVTTPGKVVIENNVFESSGSAILIAGDANYWYESGAVNDVIIRNNTFNDPCLTSMYQFCEAIISIYPEIPKLNNETFFHRNIVIENNVFYPFDYPVLYAKSVDNIDFINNKIIRSKRFKAFHKRKYTLSFEACKDVEVSGNKYEGDVLGKNILLLGCSSDKVTLKVMTWNIWHGGLHGDKSTQFEKDTANTINVLKVIEFEDPDILFMQETYCCGMEICKKAGYPYSWRASSNLSIHSKYPIVDTINIFKPFNSQGVVIDIEGVKLMCFNIWLHYLPDYFQDIKHFSPDSLIAGENETRLKEISSILASIDSMQLSTQMPVIIGGDFNSGSHLDWVESTKHKHYNKVVEWPVSKKMTDNGFKDSFREVNPNPLTSLEGTWGFLFNGIISDRIDYIYYKGDQLEVKSSKIVMDDPPGGFFNSDHRAILSVFTFEK